MVPRRLLELEPLSEAPELAWHAYAVDYGLRVRSRGLRVCALDIPLTHNSITVNLERLDEAYAAIAAAHPRQLPVQTPGGVVTSAGRAHAAGGFLHSHRWRYRWARESAAVHRERRAAGTGACVLGDIAGTSTTCSPVARTRPCSSSTSNTVSHSPTSGRAHSSSRVEASRSC